MYLKRLYAENVGPISKLAIEPRFTEQGNPVPIVLVGQNGSGKSITLSILLDAMIELRRQVFSSLPEVNNPSYVRISSQGYIHKDRPYSLAEVTLSSGAEEASFRELVARVSMADISRQFPDIYRKGGNDLGWTEAGFHKAVELPDSMRNDLKSENMLYFPYFRYEKAAWLSDKTNITFALDVNFHENTRNNIIKTNLMVFMKQWILDILLDRELYEKELLRMPGQISPMFLGYKGPNTENVKSINSILSILFKTKFPDINGARIGISQKHDRSISVNLIYNSKPDEQLVPDINMLSSGELMILSVFTEIIRSYELVKRVPPSSLADITGIVLIDEVDLHLHVSYQRDILPKIMNHFPKIQFIITAHSPLFVLGMSSLREVDIISLPTGSKITAEEYGEFQVAYDTFMDKNVQYKDRYEALTRLIAEGQKPLIITEGKTDWQHLKAAFHRLKEVGQFNDLEFEFFEFSDDVQMGDKKLKQMCENFKILANKRTLIFMFDRDSPEIISSMSGEPDLYKSHGNNVFSFCIPTPDHRRDYKNISIELYYTDDELITIEPNKMRRLYFTNEVSGEKSITTNEYSVYIREKPIVKDEFSKKIYDSNVETLLDKDGRQVALSKSAFVADIISNKEIYGNFNIDQFGKIIEVIQSIIVTRRA